MAPDSSPALTARTDADDRLVEASDLVARMQRRCGGVIPGAIAIPALAELVGKARRFGLRLARPVVVHDGFDEVRAWAEIEPLASPDGGCRTGRQAPWPPKIPPKHRACVPRSIGRWPNSLRGSIHGRRCFRSNATRPIWHGWRRR